MEQVVARTNSVEQVVARTNSVEEVIAKESKYVIINYKKFDCYS